MSACQYNPLRTTTLTSKGAFLFRRVASPFALDNPLAVLIDRGVRRGSPSIPAALLSLLSSCGSIITTLVPELLLLPASSSSDELEDELPWVLNDVVPLLRDGLMGRAPADGMTSEARSCAARVDGPGPAAASGAASCGAGTVFGDTRLAGVAGVTVVFGLGVSGWSAKALRGLSELAKSLSSARFGNRGMVVVRQSQQSSVDDKKDGGMKGRGGNEVFPLVVSASGRNRERGRAMVTSSRRDCGFRGLRSGWHEQGLCGVSVAAGLEWSRYQWRPKGRGRVSRIRPAGSW